MLLQRFALPFRVADLMERVTSEVRDPCVLCHCSGVSNECSSSFAVHIFSPEVPDLSR